MTRGPLRRLIRQVIHHGTGRESGGSIAPRVSSFPFLSGDTFRALAEVRVEGAGVERLAGPATSVVFASTESARDEGFLEVLKDAVGALANPGSARLIIHNGDWIPAAEQLRAFGEVVQRIYCVNAADGVSGVTPIPIGLENAHLGRSGRLAGFLAALEESPKLSDRNRGVLSTFHIETNPELRGPVAEILRRSRHGHEEQFRTSPDYHREVKRSMFVISPPGNGSDCHRTWEAIYLGAVPVVLKGHLADSLVGNLPIVQVEDYEEICRQSDDELEDLFRRARSKSVDLAFAPYWVARILS